MQFCCVLRVNIKCTKSNLILRQQTIFCDCYQIETVETIGTEQN